MPEEQKALAPASRLRGRDELNLIDFPISVLQYQQPTDTNGKRPDEIVCVIESYDRDLDRIVPRKLTRRTSSRNGFPTPLEDEVLVALLTLTRIKNNFTAPRLEFRNAELYDLMGWPHNGTSSKRLSVALDRLAGLALKYENSWTTEDGTFEKEFTTGLLESYKFTRQTRGRRSREAEQSWIQWASEVFADIQRGNVKELDTDRFFSLRLPISRRMYRFLDKHLTAQQQLEMDLLTFAGHLGLSETKHIGKVKERLAPGLRELEELGDFIAPADTVDRYRKRGPGDWLIRIERPANKSDGKPRQLSAAVRAGTDEAAGLVCAFYREWNGAERHMPSAKELVQAQSVVDTYGPDDALGLLPLVVSLMREQFPDARAFGATMLYWPEAKAKHERREQQQSRQAAATAQARDEQAQLKAQAKRREQLRAEWERLPATRQHEIRGAVKKSAGKTVREFLSQGRFDDPLVLLACFEEMEKQTQA